MARYTTGQRVILDNHAGIRAPGTIVDMQQDMLTLYVVRLDHDVTGATGTVGNLMMCTEAFLKPEDEEAVRVYVGDIVQFYNMGLVRHIGKVTRIRDGWIDVSTPDGYVHPLLATGTSLRKVPVETTGTYFLPKRVNE